MVSPTTATGTTKKKSVKQVRGLHRAQLQLSCEAATKRSNVFSELRLALGTDDPPLIVKNQELGRYVVALGPHLDPLLLIPKSLSDDFDVEFAGRAKWVLYRIVEDQSHKRYLVTIKRIEPCHGRAGTYQYHRCHCPECNEANNKIQAEWRSSHRDPKAKPRAIKHGAGCRKRGCSCELGKKAERERQARSRANRRARQVES